MKKFLNLLLLMCMAVGITLSAQETTAGLEGTVKDSTGASIGSATVVLSGPALIGTKTVTTDRTGYYRFTNLPPGSYTLTVTSSGFAELKQNDIRLEVGHVPTVDSIMTAGSREVVEVTSTTPQIDITQSRTQTNVTKDEIDFAPRGRSYQSEIAFAPGARNEPLQGGFQVDGAATAENSYLIEGQETGSLITGKSSANAPFEFIQEVQVKTSGIDAENGGAMGGVINAIQARGGNQWHGQLFTYYEADPLDSLTTASAPFSLSPSLRYDPQSTAYSTANRTDYPVQFYTPKRDHFRIVQPGVAVGGYLIKDRAWLFVSTAPQFSTQRRTVNFNAPNCAQQIPYNCVGVRSFNFSEQTYYSLARLDVKLTDRFRVFAAWQYNYDRVTGNTFPAADDVRGLFNSSVNNPVDAYQGAIGYVAPNVIFNAGLDATLTSNLVATTRFGRFFQNYADRNLPTGDRVLWLTTSSSSTAALDGTTLGTAYPGAVRNSGNYNIGPNEAYVKNANARNTFNQDLAYYKKGFFGQHNLKGGYQFSHLSDDVYQQFNNSLDRINYTTAGGYGTQTTFGQSQCLAIENQNFTRYGKYGGSTTGSGSSAAPDGGSCRGNFGYIVLRDGNEVQGKASSNNHGFYIQDSWTVGHGVTANVGLRMEKENLPSFNQYGSGIDFGFGKKIAPRLGAAWDVFQNGKVKLFGSYGVFYDVMKLNLAIGSFGGNYWHDCVYALDNPDFTTVRPVKDSTGHYCPKGTGANQEANFASGTTPTTLRFIENVDYRIPSNDPSQGAAVDPNIKPYRDHQAVAGIDYQISRLLAFESRYSRTRIDDAIEDVGYVGPNGEAFIIANPGEGIDAGGPTASCPTCKAQPKPARAYDGIEVRLTKAQTKYWFGQVAYTYSRLRGNYSGLTSTDVSDAGGARANPNNNRAFDEPYLQFAANGQTTNGLLATDRPNSFKAIAYFKRNLIKPLESSISIFQQASSGTPLTTYVDVNGSAGSYGVFVVRRGNWVDATSSSNGTITVNTPHLRRTPWYIQTDSSMTHYMHVSRAHEGWLAGVEVNVTNLFNQKSATVYASRLNASTGSSANYLLPTGSTTGNPNYGILENGYDWANMLNSNQTKQGSPIVLSSQYGLPTAWQAGRSIRLKFNFKF